MGIQGLLPELKSMMAPISVEDLEGQTVAVDTYSWLHKGALSCSVQLCKGLPTTRHIEYCMHRVNMLRHHGVRPILVFDGGLLPIKADQETKRARSRKENLQRAKELEAAGNSTAAYECYQKAVDISPSIAYELIQVLKKEKVEYIVAPYEADAQMAFLSISKLVDVVITEDSDLIPFGCSRIIFKMDKFGQGVEYQSSKLPRNRGLDFSGFTHQMLLEMCILSGCDYLSSLPGMGVKRAHALIQKFKSYDQVIKHFRFSGVSPLYEKNFRRAIWAFQHQIVYDPRKQNIVHLLAVPEGCREDLEFLGPWLEQSIAREIAKGKLDPITKTQFEDKSLNSGLAIPDKINPMKETSKDVLLPSKAFATLSCAIKFTKEQISNNRSEIYSSVTPGSWLWHRRLGHLSIESIKKLVKFELVRGLPTHKFEIDGLCDVCVHGNHAELGFNSKELVSTRQPLQLIHMDLFGPINVSSVGKNNYFLVLVDDFSHFTWVIFIAHKEKVFENFVKFCSRVENEKGQKIGMIHSDQRRECENARLDEYCSKKGYKHVSLAPHAQQNGVAYRMTQTLRLFVHTMLEEFSLPKYLWAEAVNTASYVINRVNIHPVNKKTPYELWTGNKPTVSYFRVFGSKCFVLDKLPKVTKIDPIPIEGIFVGYSNSSKAYRVFVPESMIVVESVHVKFDEGTNKEGRESY